MEKYARNTGKPWLCLQPWPEDCGVQCGDSGIVLPRGSFEKVMSPKTPPRDALAALAEAAADEETYTTAFFEAFPKSPSCFIRGEGKTIEEAEAQAFKKFAGILGCPGHEFEPRGRRDGYGYCKHCTLSMSGVLPILNKCCKCKEPTNFTSDDKGRFYCKRHARVKPKSTNEWLRTKRLPRKLKKDVKNMAEVMFLEKDIYPWPLRMSGKYSLRIKCNTHSVETWVLKREIRKRKFNSKK